jgi:hypothetical protein
VRRRHGPIFALAIVGVLMAAIFSAIFVPTDLQDRAVGAYPLVPIPQAGSLPAGENVRIEGTIVSAPGGVAVTGNLESCGKSTCWVFTWSNFQLGEGGATLYVTTSGEPNVWGSAPHFYDSNTEQEWLVGDSIAVEGSVQSPGAPVVLAANGVGANANSFWNPVDDDLAYASLGSLVVASAVGTAYYVMTHRNVLLHRRTLAAATNPFAPKIEIRSPEF